MLVGKLVELLPVGNFSSGAIWGTRFGFEVACLSLSLEPEVDGVARDAEELSGFALFESILLNGLEDFEPEVVAVGLWHGV